MATRKLKDTSQERLDDANIEKVIELLANKGTKKAACETLNISYNTARLDKLINSYLERKARDAKKRAEKRGKPATKDEVSFAITSYLEGDPVMKIADSLHRSASFINNILEVYGVPKRHSSYSYFKPSLIPDEACRDLFKIGEKVYSARYDSMARIVSENKPGVYLIWLLSEKWQQYAYQPAYELASLEHLRKEGIDV